MQRNNVLTSSLEAIKAINTRMEELQNQPFIKEIQIEKTNNTTFLNTTTQ